MTPKEAMAWANRPMNVVVSRARLADIATAAINCGEANHDEVRGDRADDPPPHRMADWLRAYILGYAFRDSEDLLSALEALTAYLDNSPPPVLQPLIRDARAAIAKAKGGVA